MLKEREYDRRRAREYSAPLAYGRNPVFYNFTGIGGDCTNFISQCILACCCTMNCRETFGWYYNSSYDRTPSWTGVQYLYDFLTANEGTAPGAGTRRSTTADRRPCPARRRGRAVLPHAADNRLPPRHLPRRGPQLRRLRQGAGELQLRAAAPDKDRGLPRRARPRPRLLCKPPDRHRPPRHVPC